MVIVNTLVCEKANLPSGSKKSRKQIDAVCSILRLHPLLYHPLLHQGCCWYRHTTLHAATHSPVIVRNPITHKSTLHIIECCWVARDDISILIILELHCVRIVQSIANIWGQQNGTLMPAQLSLNLMKRE